MTKNIDTKAKRDRLSRRPEPYWDKLILGGYIGYRVGAIGGSWIARYRSEDGKQYYKSLVLPAHLPVNEYDTATSEARNWFEAQQAGFNPKAGTVAEAADTYTKYLRNEKGASSAKDAEGRIKRCILSKFGERPLDKLTTPQIRQWLHSFVPDSGIEEEIRKAKSSANRNLATFKALLNLAHKDGLIQSTAAWRRVEKFKRVDGSRKEYLTPTQVEELLKNTEGHFHNLVKAGVLTGARYGELCKLKAGDLDKANSILNIPRGKTDPRGFPLTQKTKAFFVDMARNKLPDSPMLTKNGVMPWKSSAQDKLMRTAVANAGLSKDVVFYTLRHSFIAQAIDGNMSVFDIAKICGTSIEMIDKHYGKLFKDRVIEVLEKSSLA